MLNLAFTRHLASSASRRHSSGLFFIRIMDLRVGLWAVNFAVILSLALTLLGLLAILVAGHVGLACAGDPTVSGGMIWRNRSTRVGRAVIDVHGPTVALMPVVCVISLGSVLMLLIAFRRFI